MRGKEVGDVVGLELEGKGANVGLILFRERWGVLGDVVGLELARGEGS